MNIPPGLLTQLGRVYIIETVLIYYRNLLKRKSVKTGSKYVHEAYKMETNRVKN
jgi:hypothetical protein